MNRLLLSVISLALLLGGIPTFGAEPLLSGPQPGKRIPGIFRPVAVPYAANTDKNGERINPACHYGPHPTLMVFAREVGPDLENLVKRLDAEVERLRGFQFGACVIVLTDEPAATAKKLRNLRERAKVQRVSLA